MSNSCPLCHDHSEKLLILATKEVPAAPNVPLSLEQIDLAPVGEISIVSCRNCGHIYNQAFKSEVLEKIYSSNYSSGLPTSPQVLDHYEYIYRELIQPKRIKNKRVVEIGASDYTFSKILSRGADKVFAFEPSQLFKQKIDEKIIPIFDFFGPKFVSQLKNQTDFVLMRHVLEHCLNPREMIFCIYEILVDDGLVLIEVPNVNDIITKKRVYDFFYEHIHYFSPLQLSQLLQVEGFEVLETNYLKDGQHFSLLCKKTSRSFDLQNFQPFFDSLISRLKKELKDEKRLAIWGAGCHGITYAHHLNLNADKVKCFIDMNELKSGLYAPLTKIPILHPSKVNFEEIETIMVIASLHQEAIVNALKNQYAFSGKIIVA